ncbi:MAG: hypothetical protein HC862_11435 [Scytonema sp. RU_4_4]|nr:hypothetical protein [Scytonema sp. RU_4_4]NJR75605.1 hypothetical protein [Scytonema sp. CRU_2_7]
MKSQIGSIVTGQRFDTGGCLTTSRFASTPYAVTVTVVQRLATSGYGQ